MKKRRKGRSGVGWLILGNTRDDSGVGGGVYTASDDDPRGSNGEGRWRNEERRRVYEEISSLIEEYDKCDEARKSYK
jgi:hypothetical protein